MRKNQIEQAVFNADLLQYVNIKEVTKEAKIGWLKSLIVIAVWPLIKSVLLKRLNPKVVDLIDRVINGM